MNIKLLTKTITVLTALILILPILSVNAFSQPTPYMVVTIMDYNDGTVHTVVTPWYTAWSEDGPTIYEASFYMWDGSFVAVYLDLNSKFIMVSILDSHGWHLYMNQPDNVDGTWLYYNFGTFISMGDGYNGVVFSVYLVP